METHPHLFLFGIDLPYMKGLVSDEWLYHLLHFHDKRFAESYRLLFFLFNQRQRHHALMATAVKVKADPHAMTAFEKMVNEPNFDTILKEAQANPESAQARAILRVVSPLIRSVGRKIPYSPLERNHALTMMYSYTQYFGPPNLFVTISPAPTDFGLLIRVASSGATAVHELPLTERARIALKHPVLAVKVFWKLLNSVCEYLVGLPLSEVGKRKTQHAYTRATGIYSKAFAIYGVLESQGKNLHAHQILNSSEPTYVVQQLSHDQDFVSAMATVLDSQVLASLPDSVYLHLNERREKMKAERTMGLKPQERPAPGLTECPLPDVDFQAYTERYQTVMSMTGYHYRHVKRCHVGRMGKYQCAFGYPRPQHSHTGPLELSFSLDETGKNVLQVSKKITPWPVRNDHPVKTHPLLQEPADRLLIWDLRRSSEYDASLVATSPPLSASTGGNTNVEIMPSQVQAKGIVHYLADYFVKNSHAVQVTLPLLGNAIHTVYKYAPADESSDAITMRIFKRLLNNLSGATEVGIHEVISTLLGHGSFHCSHPTWYIFVWPALKFARTKITTTKVESTDNEESDSEDDVEPDPSDHTTDIPLPINVYNTDVEMAPNRTTDVADVYVVKTTKQKVVLQQNQLWYHRGPKLEFLTFPEYGCIIEIIPAKRVAKTVKSPAPGAGRKPNAIFDFDTEFLLYGSYVQLFAHYNMCLSSLASLHPLILGLS